MMLFATIVIFSGAAFSVFSVFFAVLALMLLRAHHGRTSLFKQHTALSSNLSTD